MRLLGSKVVEAAELGENAIRGFFAHRMTTYAAALSYRGLFVLFPLVLLVVVLLGVLDLQGFYGRSLEPIGSELPQGESGVLATLIENRPRERCRRSPTQGAPPSSATTNAIASLACSLTCRHARDLPGRSTRM